MPILIFIFSNKMKISQNILQISQLQSFENKSISWLFFSIIHAFRCGALLFYHSLLYLGVVLAVISAMFRFSNKLKISQNIMQKSLCQSFENKFHRLTIFQHFPCSPLWCPSFLPQPPFYGCSFGCKIANIHFSNKMKISQNVLQKSL